MKKEKSIELLGNFQWPNMYAIRFSEVVWGQKKHLKNNDRIFQLW